MSQLTSIENLRNSPAIQSRVENVMKFLQGLNPNWHPSWFFPIGIIRVSNDGDDCTWVRNHTSTHHKGEGNLVINGVTVSAASVIEALKGVQANDMERLSNFNTALVPMAGATVDWAQGMLTPEVAAAQVPFVKTAASSAQPAKAAGTTTPAGASTKARKPIATKPTKLDAAKKLFSELTPKQKVDLVAWASEKVEASTACQAEKTKQNAANPI
jgi:hypothetical protein